MTKKNPTYEELQENNSQLFWALCENSLTGVYIIENNQFIYTNRAFDDILGYKKGELLGLSPENIIIDEDHWKLAENNKMRLSGQSETIQYEIRAKCKDSQIKNNVVFGSIVENKGKILLIGNILDITEKKKNEQKLLKSETRLFSAFKATGFGIYEQEGIPNDENRNYYFDKRARYLLGINSGEESNWFNLWKERIHPDYLKKIMDLVVDFNYNGFDILSEEYPYNHPTLGEIWLKHTVNRVKRNQKGQITDMIGVVQNITLEKISEIQLIEANRNTLESETRLNLAAKSGQLGVWDWNVRENTLIWNDKMFELYGIEKNIFSNNFEAWEHGLHPDDKEAALESSKSAFSLEKDYDNVFRIIQPKGDIKYIHATGIVIKDESGQPYRMIGTNKDITDRILADNELILAKQRAEESDRLKLSFLQNMSHEIKTPLSSIIGFTDLITKGDNNEKEIEEYSKQINENTEKLISIIDDIIEISQVYANQILPEIKPFDFIRLIKKINDELNYKAEEKGIKINLNINPNTEEFLINSDEEKIEKILTHLLNNSLKFTSKGGIEIDCLLGKRMLDICIIDTGIGIAQDKQKIVFEPFRQVDSGTTRTYGGNGLGLPISKAYIDLLGGNISFKSKLNEGTSIKISLPTNM
ncbi:MAG: Sensory box histidine kinase/response regulator [Bacteroidetes bacterium]|nr:Sensory box histidine kinase/response regulator [Bacteroidota bacterium]